jgi:hypothetical protein
MNNMINYEKGWNNTKLKRSTSFNGNLYFSKKEKNAYDQFLKEIQTNNIPHLDSYVEGGSCLMVFPSEYVNLSCIFSYLNDAEIEIQVSSKDDSKAIETLKRSEKYEDIYIFDDHFNLIRSINIKSVINWIKQLHEEYNIHCKSLQYCNEAAVTLMGLFLTKRFTIPHNEFPKGWPLHQEIISVIGKYVWEARSCSEWAMM